MGSDYRKAHKSMLQFGSAASIAAGATVYLGAGAANNNTDRVSVPVPWIGVLSNLHVHAFVAPGGAETYTFAIFVNGLITALTCTITGAAFVASDLVNTVAVAAGDRVELRVIVSGVAVGSYMYGGLGYTT